MAPITRLPPPTNFPNVSTTLPASPLVRISFVEDTLREILKIVVNNIENKIAGNKGDISFTDDTTYEPLEETEASS